MKFFFLNKLAVGSDKPDKLKTKQQCDIKYALLVKNRKIIFYYYRYGFKYGLSI